MKNWILCGLALSISMPAVAGEEKVGGTSASKLWGALSAAFPKQKKLIRFSKVQCAYKGPAEDDPCHHCLAHRGPKGEACKPCDELVSPDPEYCMVDGKEVPAKVAPRLGAALKRIQTAKDSASGGWSSIFIENGSCKKGPPAFCRYTR